MLGEVAKELGTSRSRINGIVHTTGMKLLKDNLGYKLFSIDDIKIIKKELERRNKKAKKSIFNLKVKKGFYDFMDGAIYINVDDFSEKTGLTTSDLLDLINSGKLTTHRFIGKYFLDIDEVKKCFLKFNKL